MNSNDKRQEIGHRAAKAFNDLMISAVVFALAWHAFGGMVAFLIFIAIAALNAGFAWILRKLI